VTNPIRDQNNFQPNSKMVLNANLHKTNAVPFDEFAKIAITTLENINSLLLPLCGPSAIHDLVIYEHLGNEFVSNVFSNDGIHIIGSIEYLSPIQTFITEYIKYIATRVDRAAGDGTSTAIYLATNSIIIALKAVVEARKKSQLLNDIDRVKSTNKASHEIKEKFIKIISDMIAGIDDCVIDLHELGADVRRKLIYRLAYTTSKGNDKLSRFAVELFDNLPEVLYEQTNYKRAQVETDDDFIIEYPDHDATIAVRPDSNTKFNRELFTELHHDSCDLLICPHYLEDLNPLIEYIDSRTQRPLIILHNGANDADMVRLTNHVNHNYITLCNYIIYHPTFQNNPIELLSLLAMASIDVTEWNTVDDYKNSVIKNVECDIKDMVLYIHNLFEKDHSSPLHPNYISKKNANYNKLVSELEHKIASFKVSHQQKDITRDITEFTRIYRKMICSKMPVLTIGGSTIEHLANVNVVDDVNGSVSVAMRNGVIIDLIPKLLYVLELSCDSSVPSTHRQDRFLRWLTNPYDKKVNQSQSMEHQFRDVLARFVKLNYPNLDTSIRCNQFSHQTDMKTLLQVSTRCYQSNVNIDNVVVVQSYKAIKETLVRLLETVPKLIIADQVIVPNGVMNQPEK